MDGTTSRRSSGTAINVLTICERIGPETTQSALWRTRHKRFTANLRETVETTARTIFTKAQNQVLRFHVNWNDNLGTMTTGPEKQNLTIRLF
ncbi:hypothetical protein DMJ13_23115 [halophilic archaeon]|nr:hypothetical protein DMJ13_23115 [halophilic archaeon]